MDHIFFSLHLVSLSHNELMNKNAGFQDARINILSETKYGKIFNSFVTAAARTTKKAHPCSDNIDDNKSKYVFFGIWSVCPCTVHWMSYWKCCGFWCQYIFLARTFQQIKWSSLKWIVHKMCFGYFFFFAHAIIQIVLKLKHWIRLVRCICSHKTYEFSASTFHINGKIANFWHLLWNLFRNFSSLSCFRALSLSYAPSPMLYPHTTAHSYEIMVNILCKFPQNVYLLSTNQIDFEPRDLLWKVWK